MSLLRSKRTLWVIGLLTTSLLVILFILQKRVLKTEEGIKVIIPIGVENIFNTYSLTEVDNVASSLFPEPKGNRITPIYKITNSETHLINDWTSFFRENQVRDTFSIIVPMSIASPQEQVVIAYYTSQINPRIFRLSLPPSDEFEEKWLIKLPLIPDEAPVSNNAILHFPMITWMPEEAYFYIAVNTQKG